MIQYYPNILTAGGMKEEFITWLTGNGAHICASVALHDYSSLGMGTGMIASKDIKKGTVLFKIPRSILLKPSEAALKQISNVKWNRLIYTIIMERRNPNSFWRPYLDTISETSVSTVMSWSAHDQKLLAGTDIQLPASDLFEDFLRETKITSKIDSKEFYFSADVISSYSFTDTDGTVLLVPLADSLNHSSSNNAELHYGAKSLRMIASRNIRKGEQIFNTFGRLSNSDLLTKYGFVEQSNPFNSILIFQEELADYSKTDFSDINIDYFEVTIKSTDGLKRLFKQRNKALSDFLKWRLSKFPPLESAVSHREQMALQVSCEQQEILRIHIA